VGIAATPVLSDFARDVAEGLSARVKKLSPQYLYDDLGSALFEAITLLPEYGLTRADERLIGRHAREVIEAGHFETICELGSGSGRKTTNILEAAGRDAVYHPIDVSSAALAACERELGTLARVEAIHAEWVEGLRVIQRKRSAAPLLLLFLGSSIGNLERADVVPFLTTIRNTLRPGDSFLIGFDLVKEVDRMIEAYDDPTGVTAAFNLNVLGRINRELQANFDLRSFTHEARWNADARRIEMHLVSSRVQRVLVSALESSFLFKAGETIWTESSHKFTREELGSLAQRAGFTELHVWIDSEWPFAEALWQVK
jgi:L-histidine N-alpha-methyltransferase